MINLAAIVKEEFHHLLSILIFLFSQANLDINMDIRTSGRIRIYFPYTGEGQIGDMNFVRGNLALREHLKRGQKSFSIYSRRKRVCEI
jgi:hypothetical protein